MSLSNNVLMFGLSSTKNTTKYYIILKAVVMMRPTPESHA
jgi:hypothetical protein